MPETRQRQVTVERRTYVKGKFIGKLIGDLDKIKSDVIHENFFNLEFLTAEFFTDSAQMRKWDEGEFDEFDEISTFPTKLPTPLNCNVAYGDGTSKDFKIYLR